MNVLGTFSMKGAVKVLRIIKFLWFNDNWLLDRRENRLTSLKTRLFHAADRSGGSWSVSSGVAAGWP